MKKDLDTKPVDFDPFLRHGELLRTAPATEGQNEIWTALVLSPEATLAYNESIVVTIQKRLDEARLKTALATLVQTHDALRTAFSPLGRTLYISQQNPLRFESHDLRGLTPEAVEARVLAERERATKEAFILDQAPLMRLVYLATGDNESRLVISAHHLVTDGWSLAVILTDLAEAYSKGSLAAAPSFAAYAENEAAEALARKNSKSQTYWTEMFQDGGSVLELPIEGQRPALRSFDSLRADREVPMAFVKDLKALSRKLRSSYVAVQLAAFSVLLSRLCQQDDIAIGMPSAGQSSAGLQRLIGHAVHLLPLRIQTKNDESFAELVARVRKQLLDAYDHQDFTFGELLKKLPIERDASRIPLVPVMFNVDTKLEPGDVLFEGTEASYDSNPRFAENFEMFINITESSRETIIECQYNTSLFSPSRIAMVLEAYIKLLGELSAQPDALYSGLPMATLEDEPLATWNATAYSYDKTLTLVDLLRHAAIAHADKTAVEAEDGTLSYTQLWEESGKLKDELIAAGLKPKSRVGICLSRTTRSLIAQFAILRAGSAYVPLDPSFPAERIDYMIADGQMELVLCETETRSLVKGEQKIILWESRSRAPVVPDQNPQADDAAYMIYTSGSTGRPKGVVIGHQSVVNFLLSMKDRLEFPSFARLLAVTTFSFDIHVLEIFMPLMSGGTVVLAGDSVRKDGFLLLKLLEEKNISLMQATPSTWRMLLSLDWKPSKDLTILCGGEAFPPDLKAELKGAHEVWNLYGPTEATVWITAKRMSEIADGQTINVGRPIGNTKLFILDANRQLLPAGVKGEVYITGDSLAQGYWQRADLNAEKFLPSIEGQGLMYQTGDVGRFTSEGELEILGRADAQIKLRGYRIELGEIESCILEAPGVRAATVLLHEAKDAMAQIVAYLVWTGEARMKELREHLTTLLPDYMIPQTFLELEAFPLLPNGKINRKALPSPNVVVLDTVSTEAVAWEGQTAEIAGLWSQFLNRPNIGATDDFFLIGGHSLLAIQLLAKMNKLLGTQLTLRDIFQHSKFEAFARHALASTPKELDVVPPAKDDALSFAQERMWYVDQLNPSNVHNLPGGWLLHGDFKHEAYVAALNAMREQHDILSMAITLRNGVPVRSKLENHRIDCPLIDYSMQEDGQKRAIAEAEREAEEVIDTEKGPLITFKVYKLAEQKHLFTIRAHHIIWDGWSWDIFLSQMSEFYALAVKGELGPQQPKTPNYADFSSWQRSKVEAKAEGHQYWTKIFETIPDPLDLATDHPRPAKLEGNSATLLVPWSKAETEDFESQSKAQGTTPFLLAMSILVLSLHRLTGQSDIVIGTPLRGRTREEFEKLFGLFINVMPLRFTVDPEQDFQSLLAHVRKVCLDGFAQQDFPFESLLSSIKAPRDESRTPLYTAMFSYQDVTDRVLDWAGVKVEQVHVGGHGIPTDIVFWMKKSESRTDMGIDYRTKLWNRPSIESISEIYKFIQEQSAQNPKLLLKDFDLFPSAQESRVLPLTSSIWSGAKHETLAAALLASLQKHPEAVIRSGHVSYTYEKLLKKASGIAQALQNLGVKTGDRVGLCTDRSIELLEGMFGIILAGAAYVPFDPNAPRERLKVMAEQADLASIVTQEDWLDILPLDVDQCVIVSEVDPVSKISLPVLSKQDPAYVIFTSGSTGTPKAVQISQGAAIHFLEGIQERLQLQAKNVCLALTTVTFDISVLEIFGSLFQGATIVLAESAYAADGEALITLIAQEKIDFAQMTPSGWRILLDSGWTGKSDLKAITGGEALPRDLLEKLLPRVGTLWNAYGPTEATVWATLEEVRDVKDAITIGRPLPGYETFVLNAGKLAPIGVWGELYLGGPALADGYLKDEIKTQDRFIAHDLASAGRLYGTGDIARLRSDGRLEFKSRADTQVKIRGYRIELEEIETIALRDTRVKAAAAKVWEPKPGDQRLVLYVTSESPLKLEDLQATFRSFLPKYMWPSHLEVLPKMPLTPNGKLNRLGLQQPDFAQTRDAKRAIREPNSTAENAIATIWRDLLGVKVVSLDDNFFDLGGHSLLTLKMLSRINESFARSLKLRDVLTANLGQLAQLVDAGDQ